LQCRPASRLACRNAPDPADGVDGRSDPGRPGSAGLFGRARSGVAGGRLGCGSHGVDIGVDVTPGMSTRLIDVGRAGQYARHGRARSRAHAGRAPNTPVPMRTMVAPSATAISTSWLIPIDNSVARSVPGAPEPTTASRTLARSA